MNKGFLLSIASIFSVLISLAQSDSSKTIEVSGYIDCYYAYNFTEPVSKNIPFAYNHNRHNEFNVNQVLLALKFKKERVRANVAMHAGTYVKANYAAEPAVLQLINEANGCAFNKKTLVGCRDHAFTYWFGNSYLER